MTTKTNRRVHISALAVITIGLLALSGSPAAKADSCPIDYVETCQYFFMCDQASVFCQANMPAGCSRVLDAICAPNVQCIPGIPGYDMLCLYQ